MKISRRLNTIPIGILLLASIMLTTHAPPAFPQAVRIIEVAPGIHMLRSGFRVGNVGVASGADTTLIIDDAYPVFGPAIDAAIASITDNPVTIVLNTHYHGDHTGGNLYFGAAGATIIAHDNTRRRLGLKSLFGSSVWETPSQAAQLPVLTFDSTTTLHLNGEEIHVFHVSDAHTDGDIIVHFRNANVFHMGDIFFNGRFPFIDVSAGGSLAGIIAAVDRVLAIADDRTKIIPGHGRLSDKPGLEAYRDMLTAVGQQILGGIDAGLSLEEIHATRPTAEFDGRWSADPDQGERFVEMVYRSLVQQE
jgi:glyoxylase-like metal-dependent hydrolase (beta-lactamase superfamily II)